MRKLVLPVLMALPLCAAGQTQASPSTPAPPAEDLSTLALPAQGLPFERPIPGEMITAPTYTRELIRVQWRAGDPIDLYIIRPVGVAKPPAVLFLYGFPSESDRFRNDQFCTFVTRNGLAAIGFVSALNGQRYHDRPMKEWFVSELPEALSTSVHDVQMVVNYLATRGDFDMERVGIFGQGSGGTIAILSAGIDARLKAVDVMDPWADWPLWLGQSIQVPQQERAAYTTPAFLASVASFDPLLWLPRLKQPVRVQESDFDLAMPAPVRAAVETAATRAGAAVAEYATPDDYKRDVMNNGKMLDWLRGKLVLAGSAAR